MKIEVQVDLTDVFTKNGTVQDYVEEIIKQDIRQQLKKSPEYKLFVQAQTDKAIENIKLQKG